MSLPPPASRYVPDYVGVRTLPGRLVRCRTCGLPSARCLCGDLVALRTRTQVELVLHRVESTKSTNTGRLVPLLVEGARLLIRGRREDDDVPPLEGRRLLLFPDANAIELGPHLLDEGPCVLVVPDGSWSQARKLAHQELRARDAQVVRLPAPDATRYRLRRNARPDGQATLEAVARALGALEGAAIEQHLLDAFDEFVARHVALKRDGAVLGNDPAAERAPRRPPQQGP